MLKKVSFGVLALGLLGGLIAGCAGLTFSFSTDEVAIAEAADTIASFTLPDGYHAEFTASGMGYTAVSYNPGDDQSHLYLLQSENEGDAEKLNEVLAEVAPGAYDPQTRLTVLETRSIVVRGAEAKLLISEGVNGEGAAYRQAALTFTGRGGPALLVLIAAAEDWSPDLVDTLIGSIA
jgi:hypothetical protein